METNAYAVAYRLLGDRPGATAVAGIAAERVRHEAREGRPDTLAYLALYTVDQAVRPSTLGITLDPADPSASLRTALRRRLARATPEERIAGSLVHLAGYPPSFVAPLLGRSEDEVVHLAGVLAPPPGVAYRELGDPELTRTATPRGRGSSGSQRRRPSWTTIVVILAIVAAVLAATQLTGPRPTLEPEGDEQGAALSWHPDRPPSSSTDRGGEPTA